MFVAINLCGGLAITRKPSHWGNQGFMQSPAMTLPLVSRKWDVNEIGLKREGHNLMVNGYEKGEKPG